MEKEINFREEMARINSNPCCSCNTPGGLSQWDQEILWRLAAQPCPLSDLGTARICLRAFASGGCTKEMYNECRKTLLDDE